MRRILLILALLAPSLLCAQGYRFDSQISQETLTSVVPNTTNVLSVPSSAQVAFCNFPANAVPCTNKATTYTSVTLGTPCSTSTQIVLTNTSTCVASPDAQQNWGVWVAAGQYSYTITIGGTNFGPYVVNFGIVNPSTIGANIAFTGNDTHSGTETFKNINNTRIVDGVNFTTIQAAINDLPSSGGEVWVPCGTYSVSDTIINKSFTTVRGSGPCTLIQPSGGAGHYGLIMGDQNQSTVFSIQIRDLAITCPADATEGILVHNAVLSSSNGILPTISNVKIRQCATDIQWGELTGSEGTFDGIMEKLDLDLQGTQIGIDIYGATAGANGLTITNSSIRNGSLNVGASIGIRNQGPAVRLAITNNYIEFMPGGDIVLSTANGTVDRTTIENNYMESFGASGVLLSIGSGVTGTVFQNNYTNSSTTPSNYSIKIANGATGVYIANNTFQNEATAVINNSNLSGSANIVLYNNNHLAGSAPWFDSSTGIVQQSYSGGFVTQQLNPVEDVQAFNAGGSKCVRLLEPSSGATQLNWRMCASSSAASQIDFEPSTTNGGSTYTTPPLALSSTNPLVNAPFQNLAATATMGLTLKKGSGGGNYTNATTSYTVADSTNLCFTVTIPTGWKLGISASGALSTATAAVVAQAALTDNAACSTANAGILVETAPIQGAAIGVADAFALNWVITGDGASHNIAMQFKTSNAADTASLINSSATITPTMKFELMPSN